jgi:MYXO-CTERM domain-containing protein
VIKQPAKRRAANEPINFTQVSHTIFLNPCLPNGCTVYPGSDNSKTNRSSIPDSQVVMRPWPHGQENWNRLMQCVRDMYAPFDITITDVDPGQANHFEVMMAGNADVLGVPGAGGVAPFEPCDGQLIDNVISFVFADDINNHDFLCWAAAQESAHVFGLDHLLNAKDPMTYLTPPVKKEGFQNADTSCGEDTPRECWCGGTKQNSFQYLMDTFGPSNLEPATLAITEPADGAWVKPGFNVRFAVMSQLSVMNASLKVDGMQTQSIGKDQPQVFNTPASLAGGAHTISVTAKDSAAREVTSQITVNVTARCDGNTACSADTHCLGGYCLPGAKVAGGLGAACTNNAECITGSCGSDGTNMLCTAACDSGATCPGGFTCYETSPGAGVCWPAEEEKGGCSTSGNQSPLLVLFGLGALVLIRKPRPRRARSNANALLE